MSSQLKNRVVFFILAKIAILSALFASLFGKIALRWWAIILLVIAITAYTLMVCATPPAVRTAIMGRIGL